MNLLRLGMTMLIYALLFAVLFLVPLIAGWLAASTYRHRHVPDDDDADVDDDGRCLACGQFIPTHQPTHPTHKDPA